MKSSSKKIKHLPGSSFITSAPMSLWIIIFVIIPLMYIFLVSLMERNRFGGVNAVLSLAGYRTILSPVYLKAIGKSVIISLFSTVIALILGYPFAYFLARQPKKRVPTLILLLMAPFWTSAIVKIYSWILLLNTHGILNQLLMRLGVIQEPLQFLYTSGAVMFGLIYFLLPYAILPMYSSLEKLDKCLIDASKDLGARSIRTFLKITLPLTASGVYASVIMLFVPSLGAYFVAESIGGGTSMLIGNMIRNQFFVARNWPAGAALAILLVVPTLIAVVLYSKIGSLDDMGGY